VATRVAAFDSATLTLERSLPVNVSTDWNPEIWTFATGISEVSE
jgi:hypothetical protein